MSAVADRLREARALIERGWCKGQFERRAPDGDWCYCADGALSAVADKGQYWLLTYALIRAIDGAACPPDIWKWNDSCPSKEPVLAAFDKAIELAERDQ